MEDSAAATSSPPPSWPPSGTAIPSNSTTSSWPAGARSSAAARCWSRPPPAPARRWSGSSRSIWRWPAGHKVFYTAPIKALSNQKFGELVDWLGSDRVGLLTGDTSIRPDADVVVMTTEVLRNMLYADSDLLEGLGFVVMDEVHYLADRLRGPVWEEVIIHLDHFGADGVAVRDGLQCGGVRRLAAGGPRQRPRSSSPRPVRCRCGSTSSSGRSCWTCSSTTTARPWSPMAPEPAGQPAGESADRADHLLLAAGR